jgi:hypothetical protein
MKSAIAQSKLCATLTPDNLELNMYRIEDVCVSL